MMIDAYQPEGVTVLTVDSIFMMPHLGVLSEHHPSAAEEVFERDCLVRIGTCIAPIGTGKKGEPCVTVTGNGVNVSVPFGELRVVPMEGGGEVTIDPARSFDVGAGKGKRVVGSPNSTTARIDPGLIGLIIDCRGRPLSIPDDPAARRKFMQDTLTAFGLPLP